MNKKEIRKELVNEGMYDIDNSTFIYTSQEIDLIASKIEAKINYTRCCETLKSKEPITFEDWMKLKEMRKLMTNFYWDGINLKVYTTSELMRIYIKTTL
jgi:hypothetical protein